MMAAQSNFQTKKRMIGIRWFFVISLLFPGCRDEAEPQTESVSEASSVKNKPTSPETGTQSDGTPQPNYKSHPDFSGKRIGILHGSNVMGELDDCGCNINPLGGLARKVQWIEDHRKSWDALLVLDTGDLFTNRAKLTKEEHTVAVSRAQTFLDAYKAASYDAIAIGDRDLALGADMLLTLQEKAGFRFLNANLRDKDTRKTIFTERMITEKEGVKIGLFGLLPARLLSSLESVDPAWRMEDPIRAARTQVAALKAEGADVIVALAHLPDADLETLADRVDGLTFVLGGQSVAEPRHPNRLGQTYLLGGHEKGKHLSVLSLFMEEDDFSFSDPMAKSQLESTIKTLTERVSSRSTAIKEAESNNQTSNLDWLKRDLVKARTELQMAKMDLGEFGDEKDEGSFIVFDLVGIGKNLPEHPETSSRISALKETHPSLQKKATSTVKPANPAP